MVTPRFYHFGLSALLLPVLLLSTGTALAEQISRNEYRVLEKVYGLLEKKQFEKCLERVRPLLKKKHPSSYAFSYGSLCAVQLGDRVTGIDILQRGVRLYPEKSSFWVDLGILQMQEERFAAAATTFETILGEQSDQQGESVRYNLAFAYYRLEQYQKALAVITPVAERPEVPAHILQLQLYCEIALEEWTAAEKSGLRMLAMDPNSPQLWTRLGQIAVNGQDYSRAASYLEIADIVQPAKQRQSHLVSLYAVQSAWNELVRHLRLQGASPTERAEKLSLACRYREALEELDKGAPIRDRRAALLRGQLLSKLGDSRAAVSQLLDIERFPVDFSGDGKMKAKKIQGKRKRSDRIAAQALLLAGQILWLDHQWERARDVFKRLERFPGWQETGGALADCMQHFLQEKQKAVAMPGLHDQMPQL